MVKVQILLGTAKDALSLVSGPNFKLHCGGDEARVGKFILCFSPQFSGVFKQLQSELENPSLTVGFGPSICQLEEPVEGPNSRMNVFVHGHKLRRYLTFLRVQRRFFKHPVLCEFAARGFARLIN